MIITEKTIEELKKYDQLYFEFGTSPLTDTEYDLLKSSAKELFPYHEYFKEVGFKSKYKKIKLPFVIGGLDKVTSETVLNWVNKNPNDEIVVSEKLDGNSILVTWENKNIVFAASRGDEETGQDILEKVKYFIPKIPINEKVTLRGEILLEGDVYQELNFSNRRNGVTGLIRRDNIEPEKLRKLSARFYEVIESPYPISTEINRLEYIVYELQLPIPFYIVLKNNEKFISIINGFLQNCKENSNYDIDGLVLTFNHSVRENISYPKNKVKFKVNEEAIKCKVLNIEWNVTRMGFIKPVILIEPTEIMGVTVSRANGFNAQYIYVNSIGKDSEIGVVRSGDVVPYVTEVFISTFSNIPTSCPDCNGSVILKRKELICMNPKCFHKNVQNVTHFFISMGCEGMSDKTIENIGITSIQEMYSLTQEYLEKIPGFGKKKAEKILSEVKKTLMVKSENLLHAFGIPMIGKTLSRKLCKKFTIDELFEIKDPDKLGLGEITSQTFIDNITNYKELYDYLKLIGLEFITKDNMSQSLNGMLFELTGKGPLDRNKIKSMIESKGGEVNGISKNTNYLVTNDPDFKSGKMKNAEKVSIPIITYDKLFEDFLC